MEDYKELIEKLRHEAAFAYLGSDGDRLSRMMCDAADVIEKLQSDVQPVVHGEWMVGDYEEGTWECSNCGLLWTLNDGTPEENNMNFCTYCGADMREAE